MRFMLLCVLLSLGLAACAHPSKKPATEYIVASVNHSEWHAADFVSLNLSTGGYRLSSHLGWVRYGKLSRSALENVRRLTDRGQTDGLSDEECVAQPRGERKTIVISNGGTKFLRIRQRGPDPTAPVDLECWTQAATLLRNAVDEALQEEFYRVED